MPTGLITYVKYWCLGLTDWTRLSIDPPGTPPEVLLNTEFHLECAWSNSSAGRVTGHVDIIITKPDGTQVALEAVANQDKQADFDHGWLVIFSPIVLDQLGSYLADFVLSLEEAAGELIPEEVSVTFQRV